MLRVQLEDEIVEGSFPSSSALDPIQQFDDNLIFILDFIFVSFQLLLILLKLALQLVFIESVIGYGRTQIFNVDLQLGVLKVELLLD